MYLLTFILSHSTNLKCHLWKQNQIHRFSLSYLKYCFLFPRLLLLDVYSIYKNSDSHQQQSKIIFLLKCISCTNYLSLLFFVLRLFRQFLRSGMHNLTCPLEKLLFISANFIGILIIFLSKTTAFFKDKHGHKR